MTILARAVLVAVTCLILALGTVSGVAQAAPPRWPWPLSPAPTVVRPFEAPESDFGPGHRGIDLAASSGQPVTSATEGVVTVAGPVAGRGVVVVRTGDLRLTYEPVTASVHVGDTVTQHSVVGLVEAAGSHCDPEPCLHVGLRRGAEYVDPLPWFGPRPVRLKPLGSPPASELRGDGVGVAGGEQLVPRGAPRQEAGPGRTRSGTRVATTGALVLAAGAAGAAGWSGVRRRGQVRG
jgi:hypothetical protein